VDDASTDNPVEIITSFADKKIEVALLKEMPVTRRR